MREWEIGAVENIHGALPYNRFAPILALVGVGVNRIGKVRTIRRDDLFGRLPDVGEVLRITTGSEGWMMSWHCLFP